MRELAVLSFVTLDGVMQSPTSPEEDPSSGFAGGGWGAPYWEEVMPQVYAEAMSEPYDLLFGRRTYDVFASHWPNVGEVTSLKAGDGPLIQVHGSSELIQTLLKHELIDEFRLWTFPVVVGDGKRLFSEGVVPGSVRLVRTGSTGNGVVMAVYRRAL